MSIYRSNMDWRKYVHVVMWGSYNKTYNLKPDRNGYVYNLKKTIVVKFVLK